MTQEDSAVAVFEKIERTLVDAGDLTLNPRSSVAGQLDSEIQPIRKEPEADDEYFRAMSFVVFFSGFRATTVSERGESISKYFGDVDRAAAMEEDAIEATLKDRSMIRNRAKVTACVRNAREFLKIRSEYGSFGEFLVGFGLPATISNEDLEKLRGTLIGRFAFLGKATVNHFLTDYGYPVVKPDRMVMRVLHRSGLVPGISEKDYAVAIDVCQRIAKATGVSMRYVDWVLVGLGMEGRAGICRLKDPECDKCELETTCRFYD